VNKQIIFVDSSVQDYQSLINNADAAQITNALANQKDISALHILSHGSEGSLNLSTEALNSHNLEKFSPQIKQWGKALTENADILLYGCEIGKGETGQNFVKRLSEITEANIAASATPTGSTELGGDWKLEVQTGDIKATIPFNAKALNTYIGVLGFASKVDFTTGSTPFSVSIGDFNGDGKPDLATANSGSASNNASILLNTTATRATTPTFAPKVDFKTGSTPFSVSIGDLNSDGKPDLATANFSDNTASILLNTTANGATTPTFAPKVDSTTGSRPTSVSIGDINGDGKPDLAVANYSSNTASILLNTTAKVTAVTATSADGSYGVGATIAITVTFDAAVNVTGTPRLQLETGTTDRFATYNSGSGGNVLTFNYVVLPGDTSADLEYLSTSALTLNGGTIKETAASGWDAFLTLPTLATANSLGGSKAIVVDATAPTAPTIATTGTTNDNTPTITGTAEANSVVNILQGTTSLGTTTTDATGNWTFTPTTALTDATYSLTATATDAVGNVSTASRILSL
jgi:hypothetical protein